MEGDLEVGKRDAENGNKKLSNSAVRDALSELGQVSHLLRVYHNATCAVIVTALTKATVETMSERNLLPLELTTSADAVDVIAVAFKISDSSIRWKVRAVAGNHMRSIVVACNLVKKGHSHIELPVLFRKVFDGLPSPIYNHNLEAIVKYIKKSCRCGGCGLASSLPDNSEVILDSQNGVPPAIMLECLEQNQKPQFKEEAFSIFKNTTCTDAPKQLEKSALHCDLLRSLWGLPVIPTEMIVYEKGNGIATKEFEEFTFPEFLPEVSGENLFKLSGKKVVWAGLTPMSAKHCHPMAKNHPWVDRFFVTKFKDEALIVLYQDKINAEGFSDAVQKLNFAVDMIKKNLPEYKVLCVLNVVGASSQTRKQNDLKAPCVLVRSDKIEQFYSVHFAPAIQFLRKRFLDRGGDEFRYLGDP